MHGTQAHLLQMPHWIHSSHDLPNRIEHIRQVVSLSADEPPFLRVSPAFLPFTFSSTLSLYGEGLDPPMGALLTDEQDVAA